MKKPNLMESVDPGSGSYSFVTDLRLNGWLLVATVLHVALAMFIARTGAGWRPETKAAVSLLPMVPGLLYIRSWVRFVRGLDEFQRRMQVEVFLFAAFGTVLLAAVVSTLNEQGVKVGWMGHGLGLGSSFMLMLFLWSVGWGIAKCRYK